MCNNNVVDIFAEPTIEQLYYCLLDYGLRYQNLKIRPLAEGLDNLNLVIEGPTGLTVLRRYDLTPPSEVVFEIDLIKHLRRASFPTPDIRPTLEGHWLSHLGSRPAALFQYIDGRHGTAKSAADAKALVAIIARLHRLTENFVAPWSRSRTDVNRIKNLSSQRAHIIRPNSALDEFLEMTNSLLARIRDSREHATIPVGVVHHDPNPGNVLFGNEGEIVALLDFDESHVAPLIVDLASVIHYWARSESATGFDLKDASELVKEYIRTRKLSTAEQTMMPDYIRLFYAADAAEYLLRQVAANPNQTLVLESCHSYQHFMYLSSDSKWSDHFAKLCFAD